VLQLWLVVVVAVVAVAVLGSSGHGGGWLLVACGGRS
jgi:hypothetical protein